MSTQSKRTGGSLWQKVYKARKDYHRILHSMTQGSIIKYLATTLLLIGLAFVAINSSDDHSIGSIDIGKQDNLVSQNVPNRQGHGNPYLHLVFPDGGIPISHDP